MMRIAFWRYESPEEARQRRRLRKMLMLPPEPQYHHVGRGLATLGALSSLLVGILAWRLDHLAIVAPLLTSGLVIVAIGATVFQARRRYRHLVAGFLLLAVLLGLLAATVHRFGSFGSVAVVAGPTPSALANSGAAR